MIINEDRLKKALTYLAETDIPAANAKGLSEGLSEQRKSIKAILMLDSNKKTAVDREADAYAHENYREHISRMENAIADYETYRNKRKTEELIVEVWRTEQANRRKGNI